MDGIEATGLRITIFAAPDLTKMAANVKQESLDLVDLEARIVQLCKETPKGITDAIVQQDMPRIPPQQRVKAINRLLSTVSISIGFYFVDSFQLY